MDCAIIFLAEQGIMCDVIFCGEQNEADYLGIIAVAKGSAKLKQLST
jgi:hypothetical protein